MPSWLPAKLTEGRNFALKEKGSARRKVDAVAGAKGWLLQVGMSSGTTPERSTLQLAGVKPRTGGYTVATRR